MRVALTHNLPSGGAKRHTLQQIMELTRRGHEVVEFAPTTADRGFCSFAPYVAKQVIREFRPVPQLRARVPFLAPYVHAGQGIATLNSLDRFNQQLARLIDDECFDCVLAKDCHLAMNPYALRYLRTPSVFQCHHGLRHRLSNPDAADNEKRHRLVSRAKDAYYWPAKRLYQRVFLARERESARAATRVITNSRFSRSLIFEHYGVEAGVIYPGIDTELFRPSRAEPDNYVLSVGAIIYAKGYRFLVSALSQIEASRRPLLFIAANSVDPDEERTVRELASDLNVRLHVERIVDDARLVQVYRQARVFVYAPIQEALGMAPLEAMACGTPVVAVAEGGVQETIRDGKTGHLVDRDESRFADALESIMGNSVLRRRFSEDGVEYVRREWTWSGAVDHLEHELRNVVVSQTDDRCNHTSA